MASTIIPIGLEIRRLVWKDDSFKQADHESGLFVSPGVPAGMLGWWDNTTDNAITFSNTASPSTMTGGVTTYGAFGAPSPVLSNGDELTLPNQIGVVVIEKDFPVALPHNTIGSIRLRAKNLGVSSTLTIELLNSAFGVILSKNFTLSSSLYTHYTYAISPASDVWGIAMYADNGAVIDYVALGSGDYINQGGQSLNVSIPKKTQSQTIPNDIDIIQQLGISSRSKAVTIPKITVAAYRWLEDKLVRAIPLELVTPTQQATGYLSDVKRHSEAGWVGVPLPTTDSIAVTATGQELYDISFSLIKADGETNIDTTAPPVPVPVPPIISLSDCLAMATDGTYFYVSTYDTGASVGNIYKVDIYGTVVATFNQGLGGGLNAYNLWYDGVYLYAAYDTFTFPIPPPEVPITEIDPITMTLVATYFSPLNTMTVLTIAAGGNVYFSEGGWLFEYDPTLSFQVNTFDPHQVTAGNESLYDGSNIWWIVAQLGTVMAFTPPLTWLASGVFAHSVGALAYLDGNVYCGDGVGHVYKLTLSGGGNITPTLVLTVPNAQGIVGRMLLIGNKFYVATRGTPATVYIYNYPAFTLATTKHLPDSKVTFTDAYAPFATVQMLSYNGTPVILCEDGIYNINDL